MRIELTARLPLVACTVSKVIEVDDEFIEEYPEGAERSDILEEIAREALWDLVTWDWTVV